MRPAVLCLFLVACGASRPPATTTPAHGCTARDTLAAAEEGLGACRADHAADVGWPARGTYDALLPRLASHLASLDPPREVTSEEAQPLAEGIWELLDQADFPAGTDAVRGRAEDAAERLLRDRAERDAPSAAIEALDAVTQVGAAADPSGGADPCAGELLRVAEARSAESTCDEEER